MIEIRVNPRRHWERLEGNLDELVNARVLASWDWLSSRRTDEGRIALVPGRSLLATDWQAVLPPDSVGHVVPVTGKQLRSWRDGHGWSQRELADLLGVTVRMIINWEKRGSNEIPTKARKRLSLLEGRT